MRAHSLVAPAALFLALACVNNAEIHGDAGSTPESGHPVTGQPATLLDSLRAEIQTLTANPTASTVEACRAIPFGAKPCGGPWTYLIFSVATADSAAVARLVERYNAEEHRLNELEGRVSDCAVVMQPAVELRDGVCTARR